ncbi:MAG TPA: alpha/beta fold hydrolase [Bacteroidota bacterium]|nr:alpha/beta fold hydrolase [Bacteroidota bacterium]
MPIRLFPHAEAVYLSDCIRFRIVKKTMTTYSRLLPAFIALLVLPAIALHAQSSEQKAAANAFIDALIARDWPRLHALSHSTLQAQISDEKWKELMDQLETKGGTILRHELYSVEMNRGYANIVHHVHFAKDSLGMRVVVDSLNFVGGFWLEPVKRAYLFLPASYVDTLAFREEAVSIGSEYALPATLSIPNGDGPFPAVLLVHGSGPQDRDQTVGGNKMFRDIAWGLASKGVMVLRYDKRTKVHGKRMNAFTTTVQTETIDDALLGLALLHARKDCDTNRLVLLGHSLGATLAPEIAANAPAVDGVVMLAPIARPLEVVIGDQLRYIASQEDSISFDEQVKLGTEMDKIARIQAGTFEPKRMLLGTPGAYYYDLHKRDQKAYARALGRPIFIARAEKDYQSPQMEHVLWQQWLEGIERVSFREYPRCFHSFIETDGKPGPWNYETIGNVTPRLIDDLAQWCRDWTLTAPDAPREDAR